jgi:S1-C subfamily serine protease
MKKAEVLKKKNVVLVIPGRKLIRGVDAGRKAMVVYVTKKVPLRELSKADMVPEEIEGLESDVQITSQIVALSTRHDKWRPMPGGVSVSHPAVTSGTGSPLRIKGRLYIVSNAHVIGDCNDGEIGDQTWQPGSAYGGTPLDTIGHLYLRPPIHFEEEGGMCPWANRFVDLGNFLAKHVFRSRQRIPSPVLDVLNKVDIAVSLPIDEDDLLTEILGIGEPAGFAEAQIADVIQKSGATSEVNQGAVLDTAGAARVSYGSRGTAAFDDQIISTAIASPGDSGSLVFNMQNGLVGVLFAGSDQFTIINKISNVLEALGLN